MALDQNNKPEKSKATLFFEELLDKLKQQLGKAWQQFRKYWKKWHLSKIIILLFLLFALFTSTYYYINAKFFTDVEDLKSNLEQQTIVYDSQNEEAGTLYSQKGTSVSLEDMSPYMSQAVVSSEDKRFYSHHGFDLIGIGRSAVGYILAGGHVIGGGSTLTQQLAKNAFLTADQTLGRKLKELFISIEIEKNYSKDDILEMYLNNSYFGHGVWGAEDASKRYFGKSASELDAAEAATLAALLPSPANLNPIDEPENAKEVRNTVLGLMANNEMITEDMASESQEEPFNLADSYVDTSNYQYPFYFDAVIQEAIDVYGFEEEDLLNNGYQIYTNLDQAMQSEMAAVYRQDWLFPSSSNGTVVQSASVALDPHSGGVLAVIGGRGETSFRGYNRATQMQRQPGSVIKPLSVYLPALEAGYTPHSILPDEEKSYGPEAYTPYNFDKTFAGEVPMYQAIAESLNAPAVWMLDKLGLERGVRQLKEFGLETKEEDKNLAAIALGGLTDGFSPIQLASAYTAFANGGSQYKGNFIRQIVDSQGNVVVDNTDPASKRITSQEHADEMTSMLLDVYSEGGTAQNYEPSGYEIAGKTGSTDSRYGTGGTDKWLIGYTPDLVLVGWMGFDQPSAENSLNSDQAVGKVVELELESMLPYTSGTTFAEVPASQTDEDKPAIDWSNIREGAADVLDDLSDGAKKLFEKGSNFLRDIFQ